MNLDKGEFAKRFLDGRQAVMIQLKASQRSDQFSFDAQARTLSTGYWPAPRNEYERVIVYKMAEPEDVARVWIGDNVGVIYDDVHKNWHYRTRNVKAFTTNEDFRTLFGLHAPQSVRYLYPARKESRRVTSFMRGSVVDSDDVLKLPVGAATTVKRLQQARLHQQKFRNALFLRWQGACAITGVDEPLLLRASHIKPYAHSSAEECLTAHNGLLLVAGLDALFDKGFITFDERGKLVRSELLSDQAAIVFGLTRNIRLSDTNYENIKGARDPNLKSVRVDGDWRGIVFKPSSGDVYVLLYVGHHDEAYRWAENRKLTINPVTGAMQLITLEHVDEQVPAIKGVQRAGPVPASVAQVAPPLFTALDDRELMSLGVPQELLGAVRSVASDAELDAIQDRLPVEAYEGLFLVAAGDSVSQVLTVWESRVDKVVDTEDFATALTTPESQSRFVVVEDETLAAILNAPLVQWRIFLHPSQRKLAEGDRSGPVRVLGGAGTGKTVLAMHRAKWLAENRTSDAQKVLFTTFTRNLATDIEQNLRTLCSAATLEKLEVRNLDAWAHGFMRSNKLEHRIVYERKHDGPQQAWEAALAAKDSSLDLPDNFYEQELEKVILAQGITTLDEYRKARRTGRGVLLSRAKRDAVWPVFDEYRGQLASRKLKEVDDAYREVASMLDADKSLAPTYSAIVVDETQDFGPQALRLLRAMIPAGTNDLFFVGDGHQRIYNRHRAAMSKCGIDIRGRSRKLYINYRTTDEIRRKAVALLERVEVDDLDDGQDESSRYRSLTHGPAPVEVHAAGMEEAGENPGVPASVAGGGGWSATLQLLRRGFQREEPRYVGAPAAEGRRADRHDYRAEQPHRRTGRGAHGDNAPGERSRVRLCRSCGAEFVRR